MKKKAIWELFTVVLLWLCVVLTTLIYYAIRNGANAPFPLQAIQQFVNIGQFVTIAVAGAILFSLFKAVSHRPKDPSDRERGDYFADLALDQIGSASYNFGSLLAVCALFGANWWYWLLAVVCFVVGYFLKPTGTYTQVTERG